MNLDLLTKLVELANNNPNENEANLAARKVCKIIAEGNFNFIDDKNLGNQYTGKWTGFSNWNTENIIFDFGTKKHWKNNPSYSGNWSDFKEPKSNRNIEIERECSECGVKIITDDNVSRYIRCNNCILNRKSSLY